MHDPTKKRYFSFLKRLLIVFIPSLALLALTLYLLGRPIDWSRLPAIAGLISAVIASLTTYRKPESDQQQDQSN